MWRIALSAVLTLVSGCASTPDPSATAVVRSRAPANYESTISNYFDFSGAPAQRKLVYGSPETSPCALFGGAGMHTGWVVPVIYDTSPSHAATRAGSADGSPIRRASSVSGSGTASMDAVSITGTRYFFWFGSDTISAVTRRSDQCP